MSNNKYGVKITIAKTAFYPDLSEDVDDNIVKDFGPCPIFKEGQTFTIRSIDEIPERFCSWAWADIQRDIALILYGGQPEPALKNPNAMYSCCDEGLRPVIFKLERIQIE